MPIDYGQLKHRNPQLVMRVSAHERKVWEKAAAADGKKLQHWLRVQAWRRVGEITET